MQAFWGLMKNVFDPKTVTFGMWDVKNILDNLDPEN